MIVWQDCLVAEPVESPIDAAIADPLNQSLNLRNQNEPLAVL